MIRKLLKRKPFIPQGVQHVTMDGMRIHLLRNPEDPTDNKVWINGLHLFILNPEAATIVQALIKVAWAEADNPETFDPDTVTQSIVKEVQKTYRKARDEEVLADFYRVYGIFQQAAKGACPIQDLKLPVKEVNPVLWKAPARMDLALTYRCNNNCGFCYANGPRMTKELTTEEWARIFAYIWKQGVPQVVFTGGEPTLRSDLVQLVDSAQEFVTGLVTNGRKLSSLAPGLYEASLDYVQVSLESASPEIHDRMVGAPGAHKETVEGIKAALETGLSVTTNTTLTRENYGSFNDLLVFGKELGLTTMACNSILCSGKGPMVKKDNGLSASDLKQILIGGQKKAQELGINLIWYSPTCYLDLNPLELGLGIKGCSAARYNMTIEPDGSVIPCQSWIHQKCGNIRTDEWEKIWNHQICQDIRANKFTASNACGTCQHFLTCGGGCPLEKINGGATCTGN